MRRLSSKDVHTRKVAELGLDASALDLTATETVAAALRRAAGLLCPCAASTLVRSVVRPLDGLVSDPASTKDLVEATLEDMVAHGDLLEQRDFSLDGEQGRTVLLYAAPPSFVARESGAALILGIVPEQISPLTEELEERLEYVSHIRRLPAGACADVRAELLQLGLVELATESWLKAPPQETATQHLARLDQLLDGESASGDVPGLMILDPRQPVRAYRQRWDEPRGRTGRFMGRRPQAYGADLWCYVELSDGRPQRFVDLPLANGKARGCDEAWYLQLAIDAGRGEPQRFRVRPGPTGSSVFEFFSPLPMWAMRRWNAVGEPVRTFTYRFRKEECEEEVRFARDALWLSELSEDLRKG